MPTLEEFESRLAKLATLASSIGVLIWGLTAGSGWWIVLGCLGLLSLVWMPKPMASKIGLLGVMLAVLVAGIAFG